MIKCLGIIGRCDGYENERSCEWEIDVWNCIRK